MHAVQINGMAWVVSENHYITVTSSYHMHRWSVVAKVYDSC